MTEIIQILYASATGTAEDVAYYLAKKLRQLNLFAVPSIRVSSIDDYDYLARLPEQQYVLFVVSTTGDGDPPSTMRSTNSALNLLRIFELCSFRQILCRLLDVSSTKIAVSKLFIQFEVFNFWFRRFFVCEV